MGAAGPPGAGHFGGARTAEGRDKFEVDHACGALPLLMAAPIKLNGARILFAFLSFPSAPFRAGVRAAHSLVG